MTSIVRQLIFANVAVFIVQYFIGDELLRHFALWPWGHYPVEGGGFVGFEPWQLVSYAFLHGNFPHILLNMYALFMFGGMVERVLGTRRFIWLYAASILSAGLVQLLVTSMMDSYEISYTVGASGGVFGVMLAFAMLYPHSRLYIIPIPIPLKAWVLVAGYAAIELTSGVTRSNSGVAHFAHLGGMLGAAIVMFAIGWRKNVQPPGTLRGP